MREIKFRAFYNGKMKYSDEYNNLEHFFAFFDGDYNTSVLMQFAGLKDTKGKEIYEGDIISFPLWKNEHDTIEVVDMGDIESYGYLWALELTIIGNIYENTELLQ